MLLDAGHPLTYMLLDETGVPEEFLERTLIHDQCPVLGEHELKGGVERERRLIKSFKPLAKNGKKAASSRVADTRIRPLEQGDSVGVSRNHPLHGGPSIHLIDRERG